MSCSSRILGGENWTRAHSSDRQWHDQGEKHHLQVPRNWVHTVGWERLTRWRHDPYAEVTDAADWLETLQGTRRCPCSAAAAATITTEAYCDIKSVIIYVISQLLYLVRSGDPVGDIMSIYCSVISSVFEYACLVASFSFWSGNVERVKTMFKIIRHMHFILWRVKYSGIGLVR